MVQQWKNSGKEAEKKEAAKERKEIWVANEVIFDRKGTIGDLTGTAETHTGQNKQKYQKNNRQQ